MDFYKVLEVSQKATEEELKSSYRRLSKKYHPDVNPGNAEAEKRFQEISEAYGVLGDKEKRKAYDKERRSRDFGAETTKKKTAGTTTGSSPQFDINNMASQFESFFGFHPDSGEIHEQAFDLNKGKKTNPIDTTGLFERYMGVPKGGGKSSE